MKNNRLNKDELYMVKKSIERIRELSSLKVASFSGSKEKDEQIKKDIKSYMTWFEWIAQDLEKVVTERKY